MKYRYLLFFALLPALAEAQENLHGSLEKRAKEVVEVFRNSTLGIKTSSIDLNKYNQFKSLFDASAMVEDDLNVVFQYNPDSVKRKYIIQDTIMSFDVYAHNVALKISSILFDNDTIWGIRKEGDFSYSIIRRVTISKVRRYVLPQDYAEQVVDGRKDIDYDQSSRANVIDSLKSKILTDALYSFSYTDTVMIDLVLKGDSTFKISKVKSSLGKVVCSNDPDSDAVLEGEDVLPYAAGDFTANGRPDYDLDGIPDPPKKGKAPNGFDRCWKTYGKAAKQGCPMDYFLTKRAFDGFVGAQINSANINLPELNQLGYLDFAGNNAMDVNQSKKGVLQNPGLRPGIHAGGNFSYYFGRKERKIGISIGASFSLFFADYQISDSVIIYTFKANDSQHDYRRRITIDSLNETIRYGIFNFPVMFSARWYIRKKDDSEKNQWKSVINVKAGPSLMVFNTTSEYDAYISFEGLYQTGNDGITYIDPFDINAPSNLLFTIDEIKSHAPPDKTVNDVFNELRGVNPAYDFAERKNYRGKSKNESRLTIGLNLDLNLQHQITTEWTFRLGLQAVYAPLPDHKEKYIPINKTTDRYNSIYNSGGKSSYSAFGLNVGLAYNF